VLGGGLVGGYIARMLQATGEYEMILADADDAALDAAERHGIRPVKTDLSDPFNIFAAVSSVDLVIGAVPGWLGYRVVEGAIKAGKNVVDISFFPQDPLELDALAQEQDVVAVVDCVVMPGLGGMLAAQLGSRLDLPRSLSIMVGGLPVERDGLLDYKAPFSPSDVLEEYTRPARLRRDGELFTEPALSEIEPIEASGVGQLEAFNTDGLRTLLGSFDWPDMQEKTLRWPGHAAKIRFLGELGFLSNEPLDGDGPPALELTEQLLRRVWRYGPGEREFTFMRVDVGGVLNKENVIQRCELLDFTDAAGNMSMARTTGLPAIAAARLLLDGRLTAQRPGREGPETMASGVICPEWLGATTSFDSIEQFLAGHGIQLTYSELPG
jgi:saccharopine dehydrogenase-like NADP-dependent oxidoreductase